MFGQFIKELGRVPHASRGAKRGISERLSRNKMTRPAKPTGTLTARPETRRGGEPPICVRPISAAGGLYPAEPLIDARIPLSSSRPWPLLGNCSWRIASPTLVLDCDYQHDRSRQDALVSHPFSKKWLPRWTCRVR